VSELGTVQDFGGRFDEKLSRLRRRSYCHTVQFKQRRLRDGIARPAPLKENTTQVTFLHRVQRDEVLPTIRLFHAIDRCLLCRGIVPGSAQMRESLLELNVLGNHDRCQ
jgi:hypothetical protein